MAIMVLAFRPSLLNVAIAFCAVMIIPLLLNYALVIAAMREERLYRPER
jgi:hypothetical protein